MYKILRVASNRTQYMKLFDMINSIKYGIIDLNFNTFYSKCKEAYLISNDYCYSGVALIEYKNKMDFEHPIPLKYMGDSVYSLSTFLFDNEDDDKYNKYFDIIKIICKDCMDRAIVIENISDKDLINALKNNKFKRATTNDFNTQTWYHDCLPISDDKLHITNSCINVLDDNDVIDEMARFNEDKNTDIKAIQDQYTKDLLKRNIDETNEQLKSEYDTIYLTDKADIRNRETLDEFLYNGDFCNCHCYK